MCTYIKGIRIKVQKFYEIQKSLIMYDFVVIGAGINGSWTALHLAKRNTNVLLLEQVRNHGKNTDFF